MPFSIATTVDSTKTVRVYPAANGVVRGELRAPRRAGVHRIVAVADGKRGEASFVVTSAAAVPRASSVRLLEAWTASRGGAVVSEDRLDALASQIEAAVAREPHVLIWHPMRSAWWIVPLVLALSAEWWMRRRRGLR